MYYYGNPYVCPLTGQQLYRTSEMENTNQTMDEECKLNIPETPILGQISIRELIDRVYESIVDEATATDFYTRLAEDAPNELARDFVEHAASDEAKHREAFTKLYLYLTRRMPKYTIEPVKYETFKNGVLMALKDELEAAEFYRDTILSTNDNLVKDVFFLAMTDEIEHGNRFNFLYTMD